MDKAGSISQHAGRNIFTRDFILVLLAFFAFMAAFYALIPTLPIYFSRLGSGERLVGMLIGVTGVASLISRLLVGGFLRRYSEKRAMIFGAVLFSLTFPATILLRSFWPLFAVRIIQGIAFASMHTAAITYVINIIPPAYRAKGLAYFMLVPNLAMALVAPSSMFVMNQYGFTIFFLSCTGLTVCALLLSWKERERKTVFAPEQSAPSASIFLPEWKVIVPGLANFLQMFVYGALTAFIPLYALRCGIANPGLFFTAMAVAMIAGRIFGGKILDTYDKEKIILVLILISMIAIVILSFSRTLPLFIFVGLLWGVGAAFFMPACMAYALEFAGSPSGAAVGTFQALVDLGMALGPVVMGLIIPITGYPTMFLCLAFIYLIDMCYFQFYVRKRHRMVVPQ
jgi:predicted MFS family arabinose efflux permease